ncbi:hypothetical protein THAOC_28158, partial [Thalassiosira oceanica]
MRTDKEWMREDTWHFEVEVLRVYLPTGAKSCGHAVFGARPVSDGPYQPVDAADVRRRAAFGARQDDKFAVRHCKILDEFESQLVGRVLGRVLIRVRFVLVLVPFA